MKRREFINFVGGDAPAWPASAIVQLSARVKQIGALMNLNETDLQARVYVEALLQGLQQLGWAVGRILRIDCRWAAGEAGRVRKDVADRVAHSPDLLFPVGGSQVGPCNGRRAPSR